MSLSAGEKVFITGATGFIGSNLTRRYLEQDAEVYINIRKTSDTWRIQDILPEVNVVPVDINRISKNTRCADGDSAGFYLSYRNLWGESRRKKYEKNY